MRGFFGLALMTLIPSLDSTDLWKKGELWRRGYVPDVVQLLGVARQRLWALTPSTTLNVEHIQRIAMLLK